jgi:hypothetical protein
VVAGSNPAGGSTQTPSRRYPSSNVPLSKASPVSGVDKAWNLRLSLNL